MYLTRAFLNPLSRAVRSDVRNPEGLHKTVMRAFPLTNSSSPRAEFGVLHRLDVEREDRIVLLIQSRTKPAVESWADGYVLDMSSDLDLAFSNVGANPAIREIEAEHASVRPGQRFIFRLRANTTRKIDTKSAADGPRRNGKRVPVRGEDARLAWLRRHATAAGFEFETEKVRVNEIAPMGGRDASAKTFAGALFEGMLVVRDDSLFRVALCNGIGPAKAYGFGLLSIAPVR